MRKLNYFCINNNSFLPIIPPHNPYYYEEDEGEDPYYYDDEDEEYDVALKTTYSSITIPLKKLSTLTVV